MGTKREIGSAIKERMGDLNLSPDPEIWQSLKQNLESTKRRRIFSFWFYGIGIGLLTMCFALVVGTSGYFNNYKSSQKIGVTKDIMPVTKYNTGTVYQDYNVINFDSIELVKQKTATSFTNSEERLQGPNQNESQNHHQNEYQNYHLKQKTTRLHDIDKNLPRNENRSKNKTLYEATSKTHYKNNVDSKNILKTPALVATDKEKGSTLMAQDLFGSEKKSALNDVPADFEKHQKMQDSIPLKKGEALELNELDSLLKINKKVKHQLRREKMDSLEQIERYRSLTLFTGVSSGDLLWKNSRMDSRLSLNDKNQLIKVNHGALLSFHNASRFSIRTGVLYQQYQNNIKDTVSFTSLRYVTNTVSDNDINSFASSSTNYTLQQEYSYLIIPFEIRYDVLKSSSLIGLIGGVNYSVLLENRVTINNQDNNSLEIGRSSSLARNDLSLNSGINVRPRLSDRLFLNMEALFYFQPLRYKENSLRPGLDLQFKVGLEYKF